MQSELQWRNLVTRALNMIKDTGLVLGAYERQLLEQFIRGSLSIEEVIALIAEESVRPAPNAQDAQEGLLVTPPRDAS